jgi:hypothetical protein
MRVSASAACIHFFTLMYTIFVNRFTDVLSFLLLLLCYDVCTSRKYTNSDTPKNARMNA